KQSRVDRNRDQQRNAEMIVAVSTDLQQAGSEHRHGITVWRSGWSSVAQSAFDFKRQFVVAEDFHCHLMSPFQGRHACNAGYQRYVIKADKVVAQDRGLRNAHLMLLSTTSAPVPFHRLLVVARRRVLGAKRANDRKEIGILGLDGSREAPENAMPGCSQHLTLIDELDVA